MYSGTCYSLWKVKGARFVYDSFETMFCEDRSRLIFSLFSVL